MIEVLPGASFEATAQADTGLSGTIGIRILDNADATVTPRTTAGITEYPAGSGVYQVTLTAPVDSGQYSVMWDTGTVSPTTVKTEELLVLASDPDSQFASASDLGARLGITLTDDEQARADILIQLASGLIREAVGQTISLVEDDVITIRGTTDERIKLPQRPIVSISSIALDGTLLTAGSWYLDGNEIVRRPFSALDADDGFLLGAGFGWPGRDLTITYTHGYAEPPPVCKATCLEMVVRVWANPNAVVSESIAGVQSTYTMRGFRGSSGTGGVGLLVTAAESDALKQVFGRRARSVTIIGGP